jgi:hypothetical protein
MLADSKSFWEQGYDDDDDDGCRYVLYALFFQMSIIGS